VRPAQPATSLKKLRSRLTEPSAFRRYDGSSSALTEHPLPGQKQIVSKENGGEKGRKMTNSGVARMSVQTFKILANCGPAPPSELVSRPNDPKKTRRDWGAASASHERIMRALVVADNPSLPSPNGAFAASSSSEGGSTPEPS
jgi:hypothetical protein